MSRHKLEEFVADMDMHGPLIMDLSRHLDKRIATALTDHVERCQDIDIPSEVAIMTSIMLALKYASAGAQALHLKENTFFNMVRDAYTKKYL